MKTIFLITRCSRIEFIQQIYYDVCKFATELGNDFRVLWGIGIDTNKVSPKDRIALTKLDYSQGPENLTATMIGSYTNQSLYASNIANDIVNRVPSASEFIDDSKVWCYLLDDDNTIHPELVGIIKENISDDIDCIMFDQLRRNDGVVHIMSSIGADNCLGWIDSAQFLIRLDTLKQLGLYADGYCIDGLTMKKYFEHEPGKHDYAIIPEVAAYYNYFTELKPEA